ncbi:MAG: hypothetical protein KGI33_07490 [Thaumarchaeota archaeon]|nr:hypothetical protein [Nitrososphaerota archaeon]
MLAYELYRKNKTSNKNPVKNVFPIKKIFVNKNRISIDEKELDMYGNSEKNQKFSFIQEWLQMPLITADLASLNLPYRYAGANSRKPYLEIYGSFESSKKKNPLLRLTISDKRNEFVAELDLVEEKERIDAAGKVLTKIDKENYRISGQSLFDEYVNAGVIDRKEQFDSTLFTKISKKFFEFVKSIKFEDFKSKSSFRLIVLPSDEKIEFKSESKQSSGEGFVDSFGESDSSFGNKPTVNAKFLSYDDPSFTINLTKGEDFYKNLNICASSLEKINIPMDDVFHISGLNWFFTSIIDPDVRFTKTNKGIYDQILKNYETLKQKSGSIENKQSQMMTMCYKQTNAKIEILIDDNVTMKRLESIFNRVKEIKAPPAVLEIFIDSDKKTTLWADYLLAVRAFILGNVIDRQRILSIFNKLLRKKLFEWIKKPSPETLEFFTKADFCTILLCDIAHGKIMDKNEQFALSIGKIAGKYIKFKRNSKEESNSLADILTYSKYDREKLRFVLQRVGLGINLSKADQRFKDTVIEFIKEQNLDEISDDAVQKDYSYFFYKGAFEVMGGGLKNEQ